MWIMDVSGDALFPRRYLDEYEKRVFELHRCVERAREHNAGALCPRTTCRVAGCTT